jgi:hypothetical protein
LREWELSFRLGMRPWIAVAYSAPVAAASAVFLVYPIGQGSFSDGMPLGKIHAPFGCKANRKTRLKGETPTTSERLIKAKAISFPKGSGSGNNDPESEDNSLLTPTNCVKGVKQIGLFNASSLKNEPVVYAIRCKHNNMHYIGETINVKNRIPKHKEQLQNGTTNKKFLNDFLIFGSSAFDVIIVSSGAAMEKFEDRLNLQAKLQALLIPLGLCYNTGYTETLTLRPGGYLPNIFVTKKTMRVILVKQNNAEG